MEFPKQIKLFKNIGYSKNIAVSPDLRFLFQSQDSSGFTMRDISTNAKADIVTSDSFQSSYGIIKLKLHPKQKYVFLLSKWLDVYVMEYGKYYISPTQYPQPFQLHGIFIDEQGVEKRDMEVSYDGSHLFIVCNSVGIYSINIQDMTILENMAILSNSNKYIYIANQSGILVFELTPQLYQQKNLFTYYQSQKWTGKTKDMYPWTTKMTKNKTLLWMALVADGLRCFDISNLPELTLLAEYNQINLPGFGSPISIVVHGANDDILIVSSWQQRGFYVLNVQNIQNPEILSYIEFEQGKIGHTLANFQINPNRVLVSTRQEVRIIDITDLKKAKVLAISNFEGKKFDDIKENTISKDGRYIYAAANKAGALLTMEVSEDMKSISLVHEHPFVLIQKVISSEKYDDILYAFSNLAGFRIYRAIGNKTEMISEIKLNGFLWDIIFPEDENSIFLAAQQQNELMMIDIHDKKTPRLQTIFQRPYEQGFRVQIIEKMGQKSFLIINTHTGIRALPIQSDVRLTIEVFKYANQKQEYIKQNPNENELYPIFYVGEKGRAEFQVIDNPLVKYINKFYYYDINQPEILQEMTDFIKFNPTQKTIQFDAVKEKIGFNTVVVKILLKVKQNELEIPGKIDSVLAKKIYLKAQEFNYLTIEGYPTDNINLDETLILLSDEGLQQYSNDLKSVIKKKIQQIPFSFIIRNSLIFNFHLSDSTQGHIVESTSDQIELHFQIDVIKAQFFKQNFQGVLSSYSEDYSEIILQGKKTSINKILNQVKIEIYDRNKDNQNIEIIIQINDGLNDRLVLTKFLNEIKFIQINKPVYIGSNIQNQFEKLYEGSSVWLEEEFSFTFNVNSFQDDDLLSYDLFVYVDERKKYVQIKQQESFKYFSINFLSNERMIKGNIKREYYLNKLKMKVYATDGYSRQYQKLIIKADKIPYSIIAYYLILIGSAIISIFGIIKYRGKIHQIFCKQRYRIGEIYIKSGEDFLIQIILSKSDAIIAANFQKLIHQYLKKQKKDISYLFKDNMKNNSKQVMFDFHKIKNILLQAQSESKQEIINSVKFKNSQSIQYIMLRSYLYIDLLQQNSKCKQILKKFQERALKNSKFNIHRWYEYYVQIESQEIDEYQYDAPKVYFKLNILYESIKEILKENMKGKNLRDADEIIKTLLKNYDAIELDDLELQYFISHIQDFLPDINLFLLLEIIRIKSLGFVPLQTLKYTHGQCIQKKMSDITIAKALVQRRSWLWPIYYLLNMEYVEIPLSQNSPLPAWMDYNCENNSIEIFGKCPDHNLNLSQSKIKISKGLIHREEQNLVNNTKNLMIRIEDTNKVICREFHLIKLDIDNEDDFEDLQQLRLKGVQEQNKIQVKLNKSEFIRSKTSKFSTPTQYDEQFCSEQDNILQQTTNQQLALNFTTKQDDQNDFADSQRDRILVSFLNDHSIQTNTYIDTIQPLSTNRSPQRIKDIDLNINYSFTEQQNNNKDLYIDKQDL